MWKRMSDWFAGTGSWRETAWLAAGGAACIVLSQLIWTQDANRPGLALLFAGGVVFALMIARRWKSRRKYYILGIGSLAGFIVFVLLHNLFYALAESSGDALLAGFLNVLSVSSFILAVVGSPVFLVVSMVGLLFTAGRRDRETPPQARIPLEENGDDPSSPQ